MKLIGEMSLDKDAKVSRKLIYNGLARDSRFLGIKIGRELKKEPWIKWTKKGGSLTQGDKRSRQRNRRNARGYL